MTSVSSYSNIHSTFLDYSCFHHNGISSVLEQLMNSPERDVYDIISNLKQVEIQSEAESLWEILLAYLTRIFHYLKCSFSSDYNERFLGAARKITLILSEGGELSLAGLKAKMLFIQRNASLIKEREQELKRIAQQKVVTVTVRLFEEAIAERETLLEEKVAVFEEKQANLQSSIGDLQSLQINYERKKAALEEKTPKGLWGNLSFYWSSFRNTSQYTEYQRAEQELRDFSAELRRKLSLPFSSEIHLNSSELGCLQSKIDDLIQQHGYLNQNLKKINQELSSIQIVVNR